MVVRIASLGSWLNQPRIKSTSETGKIWFWRTPILLKESPFGELDVLVADYDEQEESIIAADKLLNDVVKMEKIHQIKPENQPLEENDLMYENQLLAEQLN